MKNKIYVTTYVFCFEDLEVYFLLANIGYFTSLFYNVNFMNINCFNLIKKEFD